MKAPGSFPLRDASWLTAGRVTAAMRVWLAISGLLVLSIPWTVPGLHIGSDFLPSWAAVHVAAFGEGAAAYGHQARQIVADRLGPGSYWPFAYPPPALLLWWPAGAIPFPAALAVWLGLSIAAYLAGIRAIAGRGMVVAALAVPSVLICGLYGQNGIFSAALLAGVAVTLDRRPVIAGILIGCFAFKPQLAVLAPVALIAAGRWRTVAAAAAATALFALASTAIFGLDAWRAYWPVLREISDINEAGGQGYHVFASVYAAARILGLSGALAWAAQAGAALAALGALVVVARGRPGGGAETAMLVAATGLCVPFLGEYDLVIMTVPAFWLVAEARRSGWLPYERIALAALFLLPTVIVLAALNGVPLGPLAPAILAALVMRRASARRAPRPPRSTR